MPGDSVTCEAVIWDFGGVLTTSPFDAFNHYEARNGLPADFIRRVNATAPDANAWARFERAEIDAAGFDAAFLAESAARGYPVRGADILPLLSGEVRPTMVDALRICKRSLKVGCITNNMASGPGFGRHEIARVFGLFDAVVESSKIGLRKPDPRIYLLMCEALEVSPAACVYLDDLGINCKPAAALGMTAIKFVDETQAMADLERVTGLIFPRLVESAA